MCSDSPTTMIYLTDDGYLREFRYLDANMNIWIHHNTFYLIDDRTLREFIYLNANMNMFGSLKTLAYLIDDEGNLR